MIEQSRESRRRQKAKCKKKKKKVGKKSRKKKKEIKNWLNKSKNRLYFLVKYLMQIRLSKNNKKKMVRIKAKRKKN